MQNKYSIYTFYMSDMYMTDTCMLGFTGAGVLDSKSQAFLDKV